MDVQDHLSTDGSCTRERVEKRYPKGGPGAFERNELTNRFETQKEKESEPRERSEEPAGPLPDVELLSLFGAHGIGKNAPKYVELLKFKSMVVGMVLLGAVQEILSHEIIVSLPHGLKGRVSKHEIWDVGRAPEAVTGSDEEGTSDADAEDLPERLGDIFQVGQLVQCVVIGPVETGQHKRIDLSLKLSRVNRGVHLGSLSKGMQLPARVTSVEERGYVLSFGSEEFTGFLQEKDLPSDSGPIQTGEILQCVVKKIDRTRGVALVGLNVDDGPIDPRAYEGLTLDTLLPGMRVKGRVQTVLSDGLLVNFMKFFHGTVDYYHLPTEAQVRDMKDAFNVGDEVEARLLYIDPSAKKIGLTMQADLVQRRAPRKLPPIGTIVQSARIARLEENLGILLTFSLAEGTVSIGFVHVSNASDNRVEKLGKHFRIGQEVRARIIGQRLMDGMASMTLKKSVIEQQIVSYADCRPGMHVRGEVLIAEDFGAIVQLADGIKALLPNSHTSEVVVKSPRGKFKVGAKVRCRVLESNPSAKQIVLTHKKSLVQSKLPLVCSLSDAVPGMLTHGFISSFKPYGLFVTFFGGVRGLVHNSELGIKQDDDPTKFFQKGQVVKCRVLRVEQATGKLAVSLVTSPDAAVHDQLDEAWTEKDVTPGEILQGRVTSLPDNGPMEIQLYDAEGLRCPAHLATSHLSDHPKACERLRASLFVGAELGQVLVLHYLQKKKQAIVTRKQSMLALAERLPSKVEDLELGAIYPGYVASLTETGCHVRFLGSLTGRAALRFVADTFVSDPRLHMEEGQSVRAKVLSIDPERQRFALDLRQSECQSKDASLLAALFEDEELAARLDKSKSGTEIKEQTSTEQILNAIGEEVPAEVIDEKSYGTLCSLSTFPDFVGLIDGSQLEESISKGKTVQARVLDVDLVEGIISLSTKKDLSCSVGKKRKKNDEKGSSAKLRKAFPPIGSSVAARVELVREDYLIVCLPAHRCSIGFVSTKDYNLQKIKASKRFQQGQTVQVNVSMLPPSKGHGRLLLCTDLQPHTGKSTPSQHPGVDVCCGNIVDGTVREINPLFANIELLDGKIARLDITEVTDDLECPENPLHSLEIGSPIKAVSLGYQQTSESPKRRALLTVRPSALAAAAGSKAGAPGITVRYQLKDLVKNSRVLAFVQRVQGEWIWLRLSPTLKGRIFALHFSKDIQQLCSLTSTLKPGMPFTCRVRKVGKQSRTVDLDKDGEQNAKANLAPGSVVPCRITKIVPGSCLHVQLAHGITGRCSMVDLQDHYASNPLDSFQEGEFHLCCILAGTKNGHLDVSFRNSRTSGDTDGRPHDPEIKSLDCLKVGTSVRGYVKSITSKGCFVSIGLGIDAFVQLKNLSDTFVVDPLHVFPPGTLVSGMVIRLVPEKKQVEMSLRPSEGGRAGEKGSLSDFSEGEVVEGVVRRIESYGVFVSIDHSQISGLCHISEVDEEYIRNLAQRFTVGDRVKAVVLKVDLESQRLSLGMKPKYFSSENDALTPEPVEKDNFLDEDETSEDGSEDDVVDSEIQSEDEDETGQSPGPETGMQTSEDRSSEHDLSEPSSEAPENEDMLSEEDAQIEPLVVAPVSEHWVAEKRMRDSADEEEPIDRAVDHSASHTRREKKRLRKAKEEAIASAEAKMLEKEAAPSSADDFERLLLSSPNSSFLWIKYMAHLLSLGEIDAARTIAQKAINTINYREEGEKFNVWVAWLNLESMHGTPSPLEGLAQLFSKALQFCDSKKLYLALLGIYERMQEKEAAEDLLVTMCRKFNGSAKVWLRHIAFQLQEGKGKAAQAVLDRSLQSLPRRKHLKVISRMGLLEFRSGSAERGRGIFEGILRNYPKRLDLWSVYLDQEIKQGDVDRTRSLFERAIQLDLPPKKMKFLFKRYLQFENEQGEEDKAEIVRQKAMEYVENKLV